MLVGFTTTYAIRAYHHWCCEFESRSGRGVQHYVIQFASDLWQVGGFLQFSTNKTDHHDITEILLKVAVNTIKQTIWFLCTPHDICALHLISIHLISIYYNWYVYKLCVNYTLHLIPICSIWFPYVPSDSHMLHLIPICSIWFPYTPSDSHILHLIPKYSIWYLYTPLETHIFFLIPEFSPKI